MGEFIPFDTEMRLDEAPGNPGEDRHGFRRIVIGHEPLAELGEVLRAQKIAAQNTAADHFAPFQLHHVLHSGAARFDGAFGRYEDHPAVMRIDSHCGDARFPLPGQTGDEALEQLQISVAAVIVKSDGVPV